MWTPTEEEIRSSRLTHFKEWLRKEKGLSFDDYEKLWRWSIEDVSLFWESVATYFNVKFHNPYAQVLTSDPMPDQQWFTGSTLNYAEHIQTGMEKQQTAILFSNEKGESRSISVEEM